MNTILDKAATTRQAPELQTWLANKNINPELLNILHCGYTKGSITYPRYAHDDELVGWKTRHLETGRVTQIPAGYSGADIKLLCLPSGYAEYSYLCEGETDFLRVATEMYKGNLPPAHAYCVPGSNGFAASHASQLDPSLEVIIIPDGDNGGEVMKKHIAKLIPGARAVALPSGHDARSYIDAEGPSSLAELILAAEAVPAPTSSPERLERYPVESLDFPLGTLESLIDQHTPIKRHGKDRIAKCVFHDDSTASLMISPAKQAYYCHGCGEKGGPIKWLMQVEGKTYKQARSLLRERYGV